MSNTSNTLSLRFGLTPLPLLSLLTSLLLPLLLLFSSFLVFLLCIFFLQLYFSVSCLQTARWDSLETCTSTLRISDYKYNFTFLKIADFVN